MAIGSTNQNTLLPQGNALVAEAVQRVLTAPLAAQSIFLSSGCQIIDSASPIRIPAAPDPNQALSWVAEGGQIPEISPNFDAKHLLPTTMQSIKVISRFTSELARQSVVAIDAALTANLVASVAATLDNAFINGNGDGVTTPIGLLNFAGTQSLAVGGSLTLDNLMDAWTLTQTAFIDQQDLVWWLRPESVVALRKLKASGSGEYLLEMDPTGKNPLTLLGIPVKVTTRIPVTGTTTKSTSAILWAPRYTVIARDLAPSVRILTERYADVDEIGVSVNARYDLAPLKPQSVVKLTGITV